MQARAVFWFTASRSSVNRRMASADRRLYRSARALVGYVSRLRRRGTADSRISRWDCRATIAAAVVDPPVEVGGSDYSLSSLVAEVRG